MFPLLDIMIRLRRVSVVLVEKFWNDSKKNVSNNKLLFAYHADSLIFQINIRNNGEYLYKLCSIFILHEVATILYYILPIYDEIQKHEWLIVLNFRSFHHVL